MLTSRLSKRCGNVNRLFSSLISPNRIYLKKIIAGKSPNSTIIETIKILDLSKPGSIMLLRNFSSDKQTDIKKDGDKPSESFANRALASVKYVALNPKASVKYGWEMTKEVAAHYWLGSKLLWSEMKVAKGILGRVLGGHSMTRRERLQLIRTSMDVFRLVPFAIFVIVPFMELLLPVALKLFPNMLPSTFQDSLKKEEDMKKELQARLEIAKFWQDTLLEMTNKKKARLERANDKSGDSAGNKEDNDIGAEEILEFIDKAKNGEPLPNNKILKMARFFKDELTLANIARPQLVTLCQYMSIKPFGADAFLRFQLRTKLRAIKEDDRRILWEGIKSLTLVELRDACQERGMRAIGLTEESYRRQLREWLDLSIEKSIPISLLIMSRALNITRSTSQNASKLMDSISSLDDDVINEVILAAAKPSEENTVDMKKRRIESIQFQKELIEDEREETEEARESMLKKEKKEKAANVLKDANVDIVDSNISAVSLKGDEQISSISPPSTLSDQSQASQSNVAELTVAEMEALGDLARGSVVEREKIQLQLLKVSMTADLGPDCKAKISPSTKEKEMLANGNVNDAGIDVGNMSHEESAEHAILTIDENSSAISIENKHRARMSAIAMVKDLAATAKSELLEDKNLSLLTGALGSWISKLEKKIDSTEKALGDKLHKLDKDEDGELDVVELKEVIQRVLRHPTPEEAEMIVQMLDKDKDGVVSVVDLLQYVETKKAKLEVESLEARVLAGKDE